MTNLPLKQELIGIISFDKCLVAEMRSNQYDASLRETYFESHRILITPWKKVVSFEEIETTKVNLKLSANEMKLSSVSVSSL